MVGRWELNLARTHYGGGAEPRQRETFICEAKAARIQCTIRSTRADGRKVVGTFAAPDDGTATASTGIEGVDEVRLTRVSAFIADATFSLQGRAVFAYRAVRADNGRSLTIISVDPRTRAVLNSVVVYDAR